tara:strand:- start:1609 stop:1842 length:234 start_codon:yes stop_codon:yes gene_type:complete
VKENSRQKNTPEVPVVNPQFLKPTEEIALTPKIQETFSCSVCDSPGATHQSEGLCWVCQRLKISAWKEAAQPVMFNE